VRSGVDVFRRHIGFHRRDTAAVGSILIPAMEKENYGKDVASSVVATAGAIGIYHTAVHPNGHSGNIGGYLHRRHVSGGIIPGIVVGVSLMFVSYRFARVENLPKHKRARLREILSATKDCLLGPAYDHHHRGGTSAEFSLPPRPPW
jgi:C4-dicarboxylate transporter DctM subunit